MLGAGSVKRQSIQICAEEEDFVQKDGQQTELQSRRKKKKIWGKGGGKKKKSGKEKERKWRKLLKCKVKHSEILLRSVNW